MNNFTDVNIHKTADVSHLAAIGEGTFIWHHVQIRENAQIGQNCIIGKGVYIDFDVVIGDNCKIQNGVYVYHPAVVDDGVFLGPGVILTNDSYPRAVNPDLSLKDAGDWTPLSIHVGKGASIGAGSTILPGVQIGSWAMIGAGTVLTRNVPEHGLVYGNPGRLAGRVCYCGKKLVKTSSGTYRCADCHRELIIED